MLMAKNLNADSVTLLTLLFEWVINQYKW